MTEQWEPGVRLVTLAKRIGCSVRFLEKAHALGVLECSRVGRSLRVPAAEADRFARSCGARPANEAHIANAATTAEGVIASSGKGA
jgi:hypothetical protein